MINYPNGKTYTQKNKVSKSQHKSHQEISFSCANRGMNLEEDINLSNDYYINNNECLIYKRPTPINVVKVDYSRGAIITQAYFEEKSTTDYNGIYKGRYVDFEAKNTKSKTSFPLNNISDHQVEHLKKVILHGGIAFFIIQFELLKEVFLLDANDVINFIETQKRKSIPYDFFLTNGIEILQSYQPRLKYLEAVNKKYFCSDNTL